MKEKYVTYMVRGAIVLVVLGIFAYIFAPAPKESEEPTTTTDSPTTTLDIVDTPCIILFNKNESTFLVDDNTCINTYAQRYSEGAYSKLILECRSSADGNNINRRILSESRTNAVQLKLTALNVPLSAIDAKSLADNNPISDPSLSEDEQKILNRSCVITGGF